MTLLPTKPSNPQVVIQEPEKNFVVTPFFSSNLATTFDRCSIELKLDLILINAYLGQLCPFN